MESNDLWEALGSLENDQAYQVLVQLFAHYEQRREQNPADPAVQSFLKALSVVIAQVQSCNVNRR